MNNFIIPYGKQYITAEDIEAVSNALKSEYLTQGPLIRDFEDAFAKYVGSKFAVAVANGTAALHLSAIAMGIKHGDKIITTPITFAASANCVRYCGGEVVFADIDKDTYLLNFESVRKLLESAPKGTYKGIITVDFAGRAIDLEKFKELAKEFDLWIVQDSCHSPGGYFIDSSEKKQFCGNGNYAEMAIFSFHPVKHITCGEGGMITTNDESLYKKLLALRTHGITRDSTTFNNSIGFARGSKSSLIEFKESNYPAWYMEMQSLGYNYRLTDFQAALGLSQLKRADRGIARRREIAKLYFEALVDSPFLIGQSGIVDGHAYHLYVIMVEDRLGLYDYLKENSIYAQIHYIPTHLMPYYRSFGWKEGDLPVAEKYYQHCISLPMYPTLKDSELEYVIKTIKRFYDN